MEELRAENDHMRVGGRGWYRKFSCQSRVGLVVYYLRHIFFITPTTNSTAGSGLHKWYIYPHTSQEISLMQAFILIFPFSESLLKTESEEKNVGKNDFF